MAPLSMPISFTLGLLVLLGLSFRPGAAGRARPAAPA